MPTSCCVPGCDSNRGSSSQSVTVFNFPIDTTRREKWIEAIHKTDFLPTKRSVVCIHHFDERHIVREDSIQSSDGTVITFKRDRVKLTANAFPTIFQNRPSYLNKTLPLDRKDPERRAEEIHLREHAQRIQEDLSDSIKSFNELKQRYFSCKGLIKNLHCYFDDESCNFFSVNKYGGGFVNTVNTLVVNIDLSFALFKGKVKINDSPLIKSIVGNSTTVKSWTVLKQLLECLDPDNNVILISSEDHISNINASLDFLVEDSMDNDQINKKMSFFKEQLNLMFAKKANYCVTTLLWFASLLFAFPAAYRNIRSASLFTMPHPKYLSKFTMKLDVNNSGLQSGQVNYLKKKVDMLDEKEKMCCWTRFMLSQKLLIKVVN